MQSPNCTHCEAVLDKISYALMPPSTGSQRLFDHDLNFEVVNRLA